jgi:hypothetical protein
MLAARREPSKPAPAPAPVQFIAVPVPMPAPVPVPDFWKKNEADAYRVDE